MIKHYVYFIQQGKKGPIKIGVAKDVCKRKDDLQTANPYKLYVLFSIPCQSEKHAYDQERYFHLKFKRHRLQGEWFKRKILNYIQGHESRLIDAEHMSHWYSI